MLWQRDWGMLRRMSLVPGVVVLLALGAPWFVAICRLPPDFFDYFFI